MAEESKKHPDGTWLNIEDFSPGCYSSGGVVVGNVSDRLLGAPPGSADAENTFSCYALPNNSLAACPGITQSYVFPGAHSTGTNYIVGLLVHDELANGNTEAFVISEYDDGANHHWQAYSSVLETATTNLIVSTTKASAAGIFGSPYPQFTRVFLLEVSGATLTATSPIVTAAGFPSTVAPNMLITVDSGTGSIPPGTTVVSVGAGTMTMSNPASGSGTAVLGFSSTILPGNPVIVFPNGGPAAATNPQTGQLYLYPNPAAPTVFGALPLITGSFSSIAGQALVHQTRILCLVGTPQGWPAGGGTFTTNELINYTDPPNSWIYGNQQTVVVAEEPFGYGGGDSISAGELFLIKKRGGGVVITGDIFSPTVTFLPGVQSTGAMYGNVSSTPVGLMYCSYDNGAWMWNGGSTSQKISQNLDDGFFLPPEFLGGMQSNNYGFYVQPFGDKVYFSNNWMYDTRTGGWWTYSPRLAQGGHDLFWVQPVNGNFIYCAQLSFVNAANFMYRFDPATPAQSYQWQSLPLRLTVPDHVFDIREIVVKATSFTAGCSLTVSVLDHGAVVWGPTAMTGTLAATQTVRFNAAAQGLTAPSIRLNVTGAGSGDMPTIKALDIRYRTRAHVAVTN